MAQGARFALIAAGLCLLFRVLALVATSLGGGLGPWELLDLGEGARTLAVGGATAFATLLGGSPVRRSAVLVAVPTLLGPLLWLAATLLRRPVPGFPWAPTLALAALQWSVVGVAVALTMRLVREPRRAGTR